MDKKSRDLIRESFDGAGATMAATNTTLVLSFYERLFAAAPELRAMFSPDIVVQAEKLESTLDYAIFSLSDLDLMVEPLRDLGARHRDFGVKTAHYAVVADTLTATLADAWGARWTEAHGDAWRAMLAFVAETMIEGAAMRDAA